MMRLIWQATIGLSSAHLSHRAAGVAIIVALATPMLLGATGLCVDVGYWYQQQESVQSAADAAALAAARNSVISPNTTTDAAAALAAAGSATGNQFHFTAATVQIAQGTAAGATSFISTVTIPRGSFFARQGGSLLGIAAGTQSASATAIIKTITTSSGSGCLFANNGNASAISVTGGGSHLTASCNIVSNSTECSATSGGSNSITVTSSGSIVANVIQSAGCIYANTNSTGFIGNSHGSTAGNIQHAAATPDPLAALANPPASWPAMPAMPTPPSPPVMAAGLTFTNLSSYLGYNNTVWNPRAAGDCTYQGNYTANCEIFPGNYSGLNNVGVASLVLNQGTQSGTTNITGGLHGQTNNALTLNGGIYYINGGFNMAAGSTIHLLGTDYYVNGGTSLTSNGGGAITLDPATYFFTGATNAGGYTSSTGLSINTSGNFAAGAGNDTIDGGLSVTNAAASFGSGTDYMTGSHDSSNNVTGLAVNVSSPSFRFASGTYYLNGGVSITNAATTFGAGTYSVKGHTNSSGVVNTYAVSLNTPAFSTGAGIYYFNGGMKISNNPTITLGQGTYLFNTLAGTSQGAFDNSGSSSTITFTGGTYFFDGGFTAAANSNITFGPGIYYIRGGNLNFTAGAHITANGATFVLEGTAGYEFNGGTAMTLTAPVQNAAGTSCVEPIYNATYPTAAIYPVATNTLPATSPPATPNSYAPYDGTGGRGICDILIYQARNDTAADNVIEGANSTINGIIYALGAALTVSGGASISAGADSNGATGTLAFIQDIFSLTGSGSIKVSADAATSSELGSASSTSQALLVN